MIGHGGLNITKQGIEFLKSKDILSLRKHNKISSSKAQKSSNSKAAITSLSSDDKPLFEALKSKRLEIAKAQKIPPYVVFHDKTLAEMATNKPKSNADLSKINGIGEVKIQRYGDEFLNIIAEAV